MTTFKGIKSELITSRWRRFGDGEEFTGPELYERLSARGFVADWRQLTEIPQGGSIKTGVTTYERIG